VVLLDDADRIGEGSRAICFSKRTLEAWDRLGVATPMLAKGVTWQMGRIFHGMDEVFRFNLLPEGGHKMPAFINLQQYYAEAYLVARTSALPGIDLRWRNRVTAVSQDGEAVRVTIETPDGPYNITASHLVACDGARSPIRAMLNADFVGETFEDLFLIADVRMDAAFPAERWFWFDPPFHSGRSALLHKQPDNVWRIDLQLDHDADPEQERDPERVRGRIARMLGHNDFQFEWISLYRLPVPPDAPLRASPGGVRGRCGAPGVAVRGAGGQFRGGGCREPRLEARHDPARRRSRLACSRAMSRSGSRRRRTISLNPTARPTSSPAADYERHAAHHDAAPRPSSRLRQADGQWRALSSRRPIPRRRCRPPMSMPGRTWPPPGAAMVDVPLRDPAGRMRFLSMPSSPRAAPSPCCATAGRICRGSPIS
jgi:hypothetical protein